MSSFLALAIGFVSPSFAQSPIHGQTLPNQTRAAGEQEQSLAIVWDVNDDHNDFGPKSGQLERIFSSDVHSSSLMVLSKDTVAEFRKNGTIAAGDHGLAALKQLLASRIASHTNSQPLRIRLFVDAHGFRCEKPRSAGICTDAECGKLEYQTLLRDLIGPTGLLPQNDSVRLDIYFSGCYSHFAGRAFYDVFGITGKLYDGPTISSPQRINVFTASKNWETETQNSDFWDTLELVEEINRVRSAPFTVEEFNDALVVLGRAKFWKPQEGHNVHPLFIRRYSTYSPNSESEGGLPRIETAFKASELALSRLESSVLKDLALRLTTLLNEPAWNFEGGDTQKLRNDPTHFAERILNASLLNPNKELLGEVLSEIDWEPLRELLVKRLSSARGSDREVILDAMNRKSSQFQKYFSTSLKEELLASLQAESPTERKRAVSFLHYGVPAEAVSYFAESLSKLTHDQEPPIGSSAIKELIKHGLVPAASGVEFFNREALPSIRAEVAAALLSKPAGPQEFWSVELRNSFFISGLRDPSPIVQHEMLGQKVPSLPEAWSAYADSLEKRRADFSDGDWISAGKNLRDFESAWSLNDKRPFWRIYNFVSDLAYQRKGQMSEPWRTQTVRLRKGMDSFIASQRARK